MIARCSRCGKLFVPRSLDPRCPECHAQREVRVFTVEELRQVLDAYFKSSPPAGREPGDASKPSAGFRNPGGTGSHDASPQGVSHGTGDHPPRNVRDVTSVLPPSPARAEGGEDRLRDNETVADFGAGHRVHPSTIPGGPAPPFSGEPHVDVEPIKRRFFEKGWHHYTAPEQRLLVKDALRAAGLEEFDEVRLEEMREAWIDERSLAATLETGRRSPPIVARFRTSDLNFCDWLMPGPPTDRARMCGARAPGVCESCGRPLCQRHGTVHERKSPDHSVVPWRNAT